MMSNGLSDFNPFDLPLVSKAQSASPNGLVEVEVKGSGQSNESVLVEKRRRTKELEDQIEREREERRRERQIGKMRSLSVGLVKQESSQPPPCSNCDSVDLEEQRIESDLCLDCSESSLFDSFARR